MARLSCTTPELAPVWDAVFPAEPWRYAAAERDGWRRAELRAELDALVAGLHALSVPEYAYVLTTFPLLDRDEPPLPGDVFLTEGDERSKRGVPGTDWEEGTAGILERQPRSFVTRDLALLTYMSRTGYPLPERLDDWYRTEVGLDPDAELSRFRIRTVKDLEERVRRARALGAVAYVPTTRGGGDEVAEGE